MINNPMQFLTQLQQNPMQFLLQRGLNVPQNLSNPQQIVQHLMNTGQITQAQFNEAVRSMQRFR